MGSGSRSYLDSESDAEQEIEEWSEKIILNFINLIFILIP